MFPYSLSAADIGVVILDEVTSKGSVPNKSYNLMSYGIPALYIASNDSELHDYAIKYEHAIRLHNKECKFINLSSAAVYGNPEKLPVREDAGRNPLSPYGYHKLMSEQICEEFHRFFDLKTSCIRFFSAFGEGLKKQLFWDLYQKAQKDEKVSLFGSGKESRDFIYIKDLVQAIEVVGKNASFTGGVINVANGEKIFIEDCVELFYSFFDESVDYNFSGEVREGDPDNWVADISKLKDLGYSRKYSLKEGLKNYYQWAKETDLN